MLVTEATEAAQSYTDERTATQRLIQRDIPSGS